MKTENSYDFAVIGGGSAGYAAARTATELGLKTVVIDGAEELGGLCILRGCMPSKTLIESANRYLTLKRASEFGLRASGLEVRRGEIHERKLRLIEDFASYRRGQLEKGAFDLVRGRAAFVSPDEVEVELRDGGTRRVAAHTFLVATGSVNSIPDVPGLAESGYVGSDEVLDARELPESLIVLGGGPIALELAHFHHALDVPTTVIQRSAHVLSGQDPEMATVLEEALRAGGMDLRTGTRLLRVERREGGGVEVHFEHERREHCVAAAQLLCALGRRPAVEGLGLEQAGVNMEKGVPAIDSRQRTSQGHIFAAGDACGPYEVVHLAIEQGEAAARNAAVRLRGGGDEKMEEMDYRLKLFAMFTHPEFASVGLTPDEARAAGHDVRVATYPFDDHGKSMVMGETHGCVQLIADAADGRLLGGAVVGPAASDLIHEVVVAMHFRSTAAQFASIPHYHPTLSEIWTYPAEDLM